ncbi:MAG: Verru_Chthon cassette protein A [Verrucomicrobiota bacterium]
MRPSSGSRLPRKKGAALILVLIFMAMLLVLVMAVLDIGANSARQSAVISRRSQIGTLASMPEQIVMAQLRRATTVSRSSAGEPLVWTSQPGMIRVFGTQRGEQGEKPAVKMHHRLYSAPAMSSAVFNAADEAAALQGWSAQPASFTDLNEPVMSTRSASGSARVFYPIADPHALGRVEGFSQPAPAPGSDAEHPLPMPVTWLYVLKDGSVVLPERVEGPRVFFPRQAVTAENPILGRIAFWTDDESCKLNLNTASEGVHHGMAPAHTVMDDAMDCRQPSASQYSWFGAHPAFTSLSPVLRGFGGSGPASLQWPKADPAGATMDAGWQGYVDCYQALAPHGVDARGQARQDRHFATVDDFFYAPDRTPSGRGQGFVMRPEDVDESRFFLTVRSASPELNPFGQPKIALWMPPKNSTERRAIDRQVLTASTLNAGTAQAREFAFQRASIWSSPTAPGSAQKMSSDWTEVAGNRELHSWLERMSGQAVPGFGASFLDKYGARSRDHLLISMIDMLRWSTLTDVALPPPAGTTSAQGLASRSAVPLTVGTYPNNKRGNGRFPTLVEVGVVFAFTDVERNGDGQPRDDDGDGICDRASALRAFMVLRPYMPAASSGGVSAAWSVRFRKLMHWTVGSGLSLMLPGGNVLNRCSYSTTLPANAGQAWAEECGAYAGFAAQFMQPNGLPKEIGKRDDPARDFPFISASDVKLIGALGKPGSTLNFSGGDVIVDFMPVDATAGSPKPDDSIQSIQVEFPQQVPLPMPSLRVADFTSGPRTLNSRMRPVMVDGALRFPLIQEGDIVRSVILNPAGPSRGDARLLAARRELLLPEASGWFAAYPGFGSSASPSSVLQAHSLPLSMSTPRPAAHGNLMGMGNPALNALPAVPFGLAAATMLNGGAGDWESGAGALADGAFVSRMPVIAADTPMAQMASAVAFGALPTSAFGVTATDTAPRPWQTLLFCPHPAAQSAHPGRASPPDHLWLEFFHAPVTQPWPMSHDFATEGKVNLNHTLVPFSWIHRATALHGAFKGVRITAIPSAAMDDQGDSAKGHADGNPVGLSFRYEVDAERTVEAMATRLRAGDVFRSASEICEQSLVPRRIEGHTYEGEGLQPRDPSQVSVNDLATWWQGSAGDPADAFEATGDNLREAPYAELHPRLCTQSNVYRVHYRVQMLQQPRGAPPEVWDEGAGSISSEQRGSSVIERGLITGRPLADPVSDANAVSLHEAQRVVVISRHLFQP